MSACQDRLARVQLAALPDAAFWGRHLTRDILKQWQMPGEVIEDAELLVSELVTNAQKFSSRTPGQAGNRSAGDVEAISLVLLNFPDRIVIEVSDSDNNPPVASDAGSEAESGWGLMLVKALSKEWGYFLRPLGGKTVYCVIATPSMSGPGEGFPW
jgi:anti-sigma regulatory factor (Ser/Thr protein kinase)